MDFRQVFCRKFGCDAQAYSERLFWRTLYPHAIPFARLIMLVDREFFAADFELIRVVGFATDLQDFRYELDSYRYYSRIRGILRRYFRIRVSGQRLVNLAANTFNSE